jgi:hypothetical protein
MEFLSWLENSGFGQWVNSDTYAEPVLLCFHAIGMGVVVGIVWMFDLRILGAPPRYSMKVFHGLKRIGWGGFVMNLISGAILFTGYGTRLIVNTEFRLKMLFIVLGGLSVWALSRLIAKQPLDQPYSPWAKVMAVASGAMWLLAIFTGRYIAYTLAPPSFI